MVLESQLEPGDLARLVKLSADHIFDLFTLHPSKGVERTFELNAYKLLSKRNAESLTRGVRGVAKSTP